MTELIELHKRHSHEAISEFGFSAYRKRLKRAEGRSVRVKRRLLRLEFDFLCKYIEESFARDPSQA